VVAPAAFVVEDVVPDCDAVLVGLVVPLAEVVPDLVVEVPVLVEGLELPDAQKSCRAPKVLVWSWTWHVWEAHWETEETKLLPLQIHATSAAEYPEACRALFAQSKAQSGRSGMFCAEASQEPKKTKST